jgi:putative PIN family toxin of toxin-antitoxin system
LKAVLDPGVFVSALIGKEEAAPDLVLDALADEEIEVVVSPLLMTELETVLARPKFARITRAQRGEYLEPIREQTELA